MRESRRTLPARSKDTKDRGTDVPFGSDPLKLRVQFIAQLDECVAGHALMPLGAQPLNHFRNQTLCGSPAAVMELLYCAKRIPAKAALSNINVRALADGF
jgi:hypothetical protein